MGVLVREKINKLRHQPFTMLFAVIFGIIGCFAAGIIVWNQEELQGEVKRQEVRLTIVESSKRGPRGFRGRPGRDGTNGRDGKSIRGPRGFRGRPGANGKTVVVTTPGKSGDAAATTPILPLPKVCI